MPTDFWSVYEKNEFLTKMERELENKWIQSRLII